MKVIINADDFGLFREVNEAIRICFEEGFVQQTTLMVNMPYADEAVKIARQSGFSHCVGLHLNLVEGVPLTQEVRETALCTDGEFNGSLMHGKNRFLMDAKTKRAVQMEIDAQMKAYIRYNLPLMHLDSHRHSHTNPDMIDLILPRMRAYGMRSMRLSRNMHQMTPVAKAYKDVLNHKIMKFNRQQNTVYAGITRFGAIRDVEEMEEERRELDTVTEIMVHPTIRHGELVDASGEISIAEWLSTKVKTTESEWIELTDIPEDDEE